MYEYELKIPEERIAVIIGQKGADKRHLERRLKIKIRVDSNEGQVTLSGDDSVNLFIAQNVIKAIGRGFNPDIAVLLTNESYGFELVNIKDYTKGSQRKAEIKRGRVIGTSGKIRKVLEKLTGTSISVYGNTVGIIGRVEDLFVAKRAIENLLRGSKHGTVISWLKKQEVKNGRDNSS